MDTDVLEAPVGVSETSNQSKNSLGEIEIRSASKNDQGSIAELMYSSGADLYDYVYNTKNCHALEFINKELYRDKGLCSHQLLTVAVINGEVVGTGSFWDRDAHIQNSKASGINLVRFYGLKSLPRLQRAIDTGKLMRPPKPGELYLANFGVSPKMRGTGIGSKLLKHKIAEAKTQGYSTVALDVSVKNPKAEALYQRLGFEVTKTKSLIGRDGNEYACKKMELFL